MVSVFMSGGAEFMFPILLIFILILVLIVRAMTNAAGREKAMSLISSLGMFALAWGVLGQIIGLIAGFDAIEAVGKINPAMLAGGIKISCITTVFGLITFLVARLGIILLTWKQ